MNNISKKSIEYINILRSKINSVVNHKSKLTWISTIYEFTLMFIIIIIIIPLFFQAGSSYAFINFIDTYTKWFVIVLFFDFLLRLLVSDYLLGEGIKSFYRYLLRPLPFIDLIIFLFFGLTFAFPTTTFFQIYRVLVIFKLFRLLLSFERAFADPSKIPVLGWLLVGLRTILDVFYFQRKNLLTATSLLLLFVSFFSIIIFQVEYAANPNINSYFDAWWFTWITITTIGYGDVVVVTTLGKVTVIFVSILGISMIALYTGILANGFVRYNKLKQEQLLMRASKLPFSQEEITELSRTQIIEVLNKKQVKYDTKDNKKELEQKLEKNYKKNIKK